MAPAWNWGSCTYVMGILNLTPDSFSGDGLLAKPDPEDFLEPVLRQARDFVQAGVDILDIGGESTRPGAQPVDQHSELDRVIPAIRALSAEFEQVISIDTYKAGVAARALDAGAGMVNDVWALRADPHMAGLVAERQVPVVLMHNRSKPANAEVRDRLGGRYVGVQYGDLIADIIEELGHSLEIARAAGVRDEQIILDPGIGFGKTVQQNLELLDRLDELCVLGYPILLGSSRKSFIGYTLDLPPHERVEGTAATVAIGIAKGADIVRVHDVRAMVRVARMSDAILRRSLPQKEQAPSDSIGGL